MNKSVVAAMCGLSAALSVVLMFLGGLFYVFSYTVPMLLGLIIITVRKTFGNRAAFAVYFSVSVLSMILVSEKESVLMYFLFYGYYPIIKPYIEKIKPRAVSFLVKLLLFNLSVLVIELLCVYVFQIPFFDDGVFSAAMLIFFAAAMNLSFLMYEFLLKYSLILYEKRIEKRIKKLFK